MVTGTPEDPNLTETYCILEEDIGWIYFLEYDMAVEDVAGLYPDEHRYLAPSWGVAAAHERHSDEAVASLATAGYADDGTRLLGELDGAESEGESPAASSSPASSYTGMAGDAGIDWAGCNAPYTTTDWVGNQFQLTLCWTAQDEVVSLYEYDASQHAGMTAEYTETTHIARTWGVAADSEQLLSQVVANLRQAGYAE